jgi:hypothetical protein
METLDIGNPILYAFLKRTSFGRKESKIRIDLQTEREQAIALFPFMSSGTIRDDIPIGITASLYITGY